MKTLNQLSLALIIHIEGSLTAPVDSEVKPPTALQSEFLALQYAAKIATAAYAGCQGKIEDVKITDQIYNNRTGAQGFVGYSNQRKRIIVSLRGSDETIDILNDLNIFQEKVSTLRGMRDAPPDAKIMRGVHGPWSSVQDEVLAAVKQRSIEHPNYAIQATGHSLGGSMTYVAFVALAKAFPDRDLHGISLAAFPIGSEGWVNYATDLVTNHEARAVSQDSNSRVSIDSVDSLSLALSEEGKGSQDSMDASSHEKAQIPRSPKPSMKLAGPPKPLRTMLRGTEHKDGTPNMFTIPKTSLTSEFQMLHHYGSEFYYMGPAELPDIPVPAPRDASARNDETPGLGAQMTLRCIGERDRACSAGNGALIPTERHVYSFGVKTGNSGQGARDCRASGGKPEKGRLLAVGRGYVESVSEQGTIHTRWFDETGQGL